MKHKEVRRLRRKIRNTPLSESRDTLREKARVESFAKNFASGLEGLPYKIMDRYYRPEHYASLDVLTEVGFGETQKYSKLPIILISLLVAYLIFKS
jgi:hypothetical protein